MKHKPNMVEIEFSRPISVDKIPAAGMTETHEARESERKALAERFGLLDLPLLRGELSVGPTRSDQTIPVSGKITADVVQQCVVTLEPLPVHIEQEISLLYGAEPEQGTGSGAGTDLDEYEPIIDGSIDLGELIAQHLGVSLDPYPRKPGLAPLDQSFEPAEKGEGKPDNPFAQLIHLNNKTDK